MVLKPFENKHIPHIFMLTNIISKIIFVGTKNLDIVPRTPEKAEIKNPWCKEPLNSNSLDIILLNRRTLVIHTLWHIQFLLWSVKMGIIIPILKKQILGSERFKRHDIIIKYGAGT